MKGFKTVVCFTTIVALLMVCGYAFLQNYGTEILSVVVTNIKQTF